MKPALFFSLILCCFLMVRCDGPFPSEPKTGVPSDHQDNKKGAMHKGGSNSPFGSGDCSDSDCHQNDLRGGVVEFEGRTTVTPSCYQCHGNKWEDDD